MSTLSVSVLALIVFVVGAVLLFNLWQARGSRRPGRGKEEVTSAFKVAAASGGRNAGPRHAAGRDGGRDASGRDAAGRDLRDAPGPQLPGADQNAWTRQRREPTLVPDDETAPAAASPARDTHASASALGAARDEREEGGWYAPADEHETAAARYAAGATRTGAADGQNSASAGARRAGAAGGGTPAPQFGDGWDSGRGDGEAPLPDPDEDLGPPQFQDPPLDPIPPEPLNLELSRAEPPHVTPRLEPSAFDDVESPAERAERAGAAGGTSMGAGGEGGRPEDVPAHVPAHMPAVIDHVVTLIPRAPVNAERLIALTSSLRHVGSKTVRMEIDSGQGRWVPLQSGVMVGRLRCSVLLANRQGSLNAVELSDFSAAMEALASRIGAGFAAPDMNQVLRQARELDGIAARLDTQVDLGVEASAPIVAQKLAAVARKLDLVDRGGRFACIHDGGDLLYTLVPGATSDLLTFVLDVPRTAEEHDPWRRMVACASSCAHQTGGRVVDSAGRGMSVAMIDNVGLQIHKRYQELAAAGLKAGSPAALRVFN